MKRFIVIISFLFPFIINAQDVGKWGAGSVYKLSGKIYTLSCFVSGANEEWTYNEKLEMLNLLNES